MEILESEPLGLKHLLRTGQTKPIKKSGLELIVRHAVLLAAAYVIYPIPEFLRHPVLTDLCKQTTRVLYGGPLQNAAYRHVKGSRVENLEDSRIEDAALTEMSLKTSCISAQIFRLMNISLR